MTIKKRWRIIDKTNIFILNQELYKDNIYKVYLKDPYHGRKFIYHEGLCSYKGSVTLFKEEKYHNGIKKSIQPIIYRIRFVENNKLEEEQMNSEIKEGQKFDDGKTRYDLIDTYALDQLAEIYTHGAQKYADNNWRKGFKWGRIFGALMRHSWAFWRGEDLDPESGLPHMAHAAWCCFTLINFSKTGIGEDDRIKNEVMRNE